MKSEAKVFSLFFLFVDESESCILVSYHSLVGFSIIYFKFTLFPSVHFEF